MQKRCEQSQLHLLKVSKHLISILLLIHIISQFNLAAVAEAYNSHHRPCKIHPHTVNISIHVNLIFAGPLPLFMREESWKNEQTRQKFVKALSSTITQHSAPTPPDTSFPSFIQPPENDQCSVIAYSYNYSFSTATPYVTKQLDSTLNDLVSKSTSLFIDTVSAADAFYKQLNLPKNINIREYTLLLYNPVSVPPQHGYRSQPAAPVRTQGYASTERFAFIDLAARPFFLSDGPLTVGDSLMPFSEDLMKYAKALHLICSSLFTPSPAIQMRRYPAESRIAFKLFEIDVSAVIGRIAGTGGDSLENVTIGKSFDTIHFESLLNQLLQPPLFSKKQISVSVQTVDVKKDLHIAMSVARAFSMRGLELVLDSSALLQDLLQTNSDQNVYFVDKSFVAHIPLYLFSFADSTRITHFDTRENLRAQTIDKQAVFMVENRIRDQEIDEHETITSQAVKEVLQLICGLTTETLAYMNGGTEEIPLVIQDIASRNVLTQELDWSDTVASWKATELLNYQGLDERFIPHEKGSIIQNGRNELQGSVKRLHSTWIQVGESLSLKGLEDATLNVVEKSRVFQNHLHEEICNQPLPEEILLRAEVELETDPRRQYNKEHHPSFFKWTLLPVLIGIIVGISAYRETNRSKRPRNSSFLDLPMATSMGGRDLSAPTRWFSTLSQSDKPKIN